MQDSTDTFSNVLKTKPDNEKNKMFSNYLKLNKNNSIPIDTLRKIYKAAWNGLTYLTTISLNYYLLADGTGSALMSIGSLTRGRLLDLEILCEMGDLPSETHKQYNHDAKHSIPDVVWRWVKEKCPYLKVHMVLGKLISNTTFVVLCHFLKKSDMANLIIYSPVVVPTVV